MKFNDEVPRFVIDLELPPERRWAEVIAADLEVARSLLEAGWNDALQEAADQTGKPLWLLQAGAWLARGPFHLSYRMSRGRYLPEIYAWADALGASRSQMVLMQCMYELSHLDPTKPATGCTAGARWIDGMGMVHVRTLDWNMPAIGPATRVFEFRRGARKHFVVGLPGLIGALSGMVPGGFSITLNWAPPASFPFFHSAPLYEIRETLESCDTYAEAVARLRDAKLSSSVFFTVCGAKPGEACVIERVKTQFTGGHEFRIREMAGGVIAQSNHYQHPDFEKFNGRVKDSGSLLMRTSRERAALLAESLRKISCATSVAGLAQSLGDGPVENEETRQKMVFCPAKGELCVWREVP